ncbi:MAG: CAP domain-containing protein [Bacteroidia bacterium]|nr:CAP domain-containing protein [Bacteroidia bacterium]
MTEPVRKPLITALFTLLLLGSCLLKAQTPSTRINFKNLDQPYLESLILAKVNALRMELEASPLVNDSILQVAAQDQATYLVRLKKLSHNQPSSAKKTVALRVQHYGGSHGLFGENVLFSTPGPSVMKDKSVLTGKTYGEMAEKMFLSWKFSPGHYANLIDRDYRTSGIRFAVDPKLKRIYAAQVFGDTPWIPPSGVLVTKNAWGVKPFDASTCNCLKDIDFLSENLANYSYIQNGSIFLSYRDLDEIKKLIGGPGDAIAIDLVTRNQFPWCAPNRLHGSEVYDGIMLKPMPGKKLLADNQSKEKGEFLADLGKFPAGIDNDFQVNLIIIKNGRFCRYSWQSEVLEDDMELISRPWIFDEKKGDLKPIKLSKRYYFNIPFEKNKYAFKPADIQPLLDSLRPFEGMIREVRIRAFSSVEGSTENNQKLQNLRGQSILQAMQTLQSRTFNPVLSSFENWDGFYHDIADSDFRYLARLDSAQIKQRLLTDTALVRKLEPILSGHRKAEITVIVEGKIIRTLDGTNLLAGLETACADENALLAHLISSRLLKEYKSGKTDLFALAAIQIPARKDFLPVWNNVLGILHESSQGFLNVYDFGNYLASYDLQSDQLDKLEDLYLLNPNYLSLKLNYINYFTPKLRFALPRKARPDLISKALFTLEDTRVSEAEQSLLWLNYNLAAAEYFLHTREYAKRSAALSDIRNHYLKLRLTREETLKLALYFNQNYRMSWTIQLMQPFLDKADYDAPFLYTYLSAAQFYPNMVKAADFEAWMEKAIRLDSDFFCQMMRNQL